MQLLLLLAVEVGDPVPRGGMSARAHVFVALTTLLSLVFVVRLVRRHRLRSKYSMLWIGIGLVMGTIAAFPGLLDNTSYAIGIDYPPATFLVLSVAFLFLVVVQFSWELSRMEDRTRSLAEEIALLRARHEALVDKVDAAATDPPVSHGTGDGQTRVGLGPLPGGPG